MIDVFYNDRDMLNIVDLNEEISPRFWLPSIFS